MEYSTINLELPDNKSRKFYYRESSSGDAGAITQVFKNHDYDISHFTHHVKLLQYASKHEKLLIVDAGANIGTSAVYFAVNYPTAKVIAIEPEGENFKLMALNVHGMNVIPTLGALHHTFGKELFISDPGIGDMSFRTGVTGKHSVLTTSVDYILWKQINAGEVPFICKIDIEGAEKEVFCDNYLWMRHFPLIIVELHDWMLPGKGTSQRFLKALGEFDFDVVMRGENCFCFNNDILYV